MKLLRKDIPTAALNNANLALLQKRGMPKAGAYRQILQNWWLEEYDILVQDNWSSLMFKSEQAYTMFILKWS